MLRYVGSSLLLLSAIFVALLWFDRHAAEVETSVVKVQMAEGHGSGVYIGNGLFLTANHVLSDENPKVILTNGNEYPATILWRSADYDIALVKAKDHIEANKASLSCEPLQIGDELFFRGNPLNLFNQTAYGRVSGSLIETTKSWKAVVPVNGTMIPGMSGGPAFNASGEIAGINVGTMMMSNEMGFGTFTGYGFIVPSSAICQLLAR